MFVFQYPASDAGLTGVNLYSARHKIMMHSVSLRVTVPQGKVRTCDTQALIYRRRRAHNALGNCDPLHLASQEAQMA